MSIALAALAELARQVSKAQNGNEMVFTASTGGSEL